MNRFLSLLTFLFLLSCTAFAQKIISFKAMGHEDEAIEGMSGSTAYFLKIDPLTEMNGSKLVLIFEPSQALIRERSFINVLINDKPAYSSRLNKDSIQQLSFTLSRNDLSGDKYLKIQIKTLLTVSDEKCKDLYNPAMWLKVKAYSYLSLVKSNANLFNNINISNSFGAMRAIVYPKNAGLHDMKAVAWAYARLKKAGVRNIAVYPDGGLPDSVKNYVAVGNIAHLSPAQRSRLTIVPQTGEGLFFLSKSLISAADTVVRLTNAGTKIVSTKSVVTNTVPSQVLYITGADDTGYEKAIMALGNVNILNSTFGDYLIINKAENAFIKTTDENRSKLSFRQIGGTTNFLSGVGNLKSIYNFKNSDFSFTPKEVEIRVIGNYSSLSAGDRGFLNIYLNGMLIQTEKLDGNGKLNTSVVINRYQHQKYNTLETEFRFYSNGGNCLNNFNGFFAEVDVDKSYLESKNPFVTKDLSFYRYPEAFNNGTTRVIISRKYTAHAAAALGEIIYELNNNINADNFPQFFYSDQVNPSDLKKDHVIALLSQDDRLMDNFMDAPIQFNRKFRLYYTEQDKVAYELSDSVSSGLAQIFYGKNKNAILLLTATGKDLDKAFLSASRSITEQLSTLSSNVAIADAVNNHYLFNISSSSENLLYVDSKSELTRFWESYNLYILLGVLVLILLSFLYIRAKVQSSQDIFND